MSICLQMMSFVNYIKFVLGLEVTLKLIYNMSYDYVHEGTNMSVLSLNNFYHTLTIYAIL